MTASSCEDSERRRHDTRRTFRRPTIGATRPPPLDSFRNSLQLESQIAHRLPTLFGILGQTPLDQPIQRGWRTGCNVPIAGGSVCRIAPITLACVLPSNARRPVVIS